MAGVYSCMSGVSWVQPAPWLLKARISPVSEDDTDLSGVKLYGHLPVYGSVKCSKSKGSPGKIVAAVAGGFRGGGGGGASRESSYASFRLANVMLRS
ncbi:hypothetical protein AAC387_Pa01g0485 [Persea americana]